MVGVKQQICEKHYAESKTLHGKLCNDLALGYPWGSGPN